MHVLLGVLYCLVGLVLTIPYLLIIGTAELSRPGVEFIFLLGPAALFILGFMVTGGWPKCRRLQDFDDFTRGNRVGAYVIVFWFAIPFLSAAASLVASGLGYQGLARFLFEERYTWLILCPMLAVVTFCVAGFAVHVWQTFCTRVASVVAGFRGGGGAPPSGPSAGDADGQTDGPVSRADTAPRADSHNDNDGRLELVGPTPIPQL